MYTGASTPSSSPACPSFFILHTLLLFRPSVFFRPHSSVRFSILLITTSTFIHAGQITPGPVPCHTSQVAGNTHSASVIVNETSSLKAFQSPEPHLPLFPRQGSSLLVFWIRSAVERRLFWSSSSSLEAKYGTNRNFLCQWLRITKMHWRWGPRAIEEGRSPGIRIPHFRFTGHTLVMQCQDVSEWSRYVAFHLSYCIYHEGGSNFLR